MNKKLRVALLQLIPSEDQEANLKKGEHYCRMAKKMGADIAVFPEMWNTGYQFFNDSELHKTCKPKTKSHDQLLKKLHTQAIEESSPFVKHFQKLAQELEMAIVITYLENKQGMLRNTATLIDRHGKAVLTYAKVHTIEPKLEALLTPGEDFYACDLDTQNGPVKIGLMICFDRAFPESARILMLKGAEIILTPNASDLDENRIGLFKARAFENMLGVAMANYAAPQNNGHSCAFDGIIRNADGSSRNPLVIEVGGQEGVFLADFDLHELRQYRKREIMRDVCRKPQTYGVLASTKI